MPKRQTAKQVLSKYRPQPEIQCVHVLTHRLLRTIQVLLQPLFSPRRTFPVRSCSQNWYAVLLANTARVILTVPLPPQDSL